MNILLKYFIFFLLGIIIYYFLFNSPVGQKVIEGFDLGTLGDFNTSSPMYVSTGLTFDSSSRAFTGEVNLGDTISIDNFTLDVNKSYYPTSEGDSTPITAANHSPLTVTLQTDAETFTPLTLTLSAVESGEGAPDPVPHELSYSDVIPDLPTFINDDGTDGNNIINDNNEDANIIMYKPTDTTTTEYPQVIFHYNTSDSSIDYMGLVDIYIILTADQLVRTNLGSAIDTGGLTISDARITDDSGGSITYKLLKLTGKTIKDINILTGEIQNPNNLYDFDGKTIALAATTFSPPSLTERTVTLNYFHYIRIYLDLEEEATQASQGVEGELEEGKLMMTAAFKFGTDGLPQETRGCRAIGSWGAAEGDWCETTHGYGMRAKSDLQPVGRDCNPNEIGSDAASNPLFGTTNCAASVETCCESRTCGRINSEMEGGAELCRGKRLRSSTICERGISLEDCKDVCCGGDIHGYIEKLFTDIRSLNRNSGYNIVNRINHEHIRNFIYASLLDFDEIKEAIKGESTISDIDFSESKYNFLKTEQEMNSDDAPQLRNTFLKFLDVYIHYGKIKLSDILRDNIVQNGTFSESGGSNFGNVYDFITGTTNRVNPTIHFVAAENCINGIDDNCITEADGGYKTPLQKMIELADPANLSHIILKTDITEGTSVPSGGDAEARLGQEGTARGLPEIVTNYTQFLSNYFGGEISDTTISGLEIKESIFALNIKFRYDSMGQNTKTPLEVSFPMISTEGLTSSEFASIM